MDKTAETLFNYVRDIIYKPKKASIDLNEIPSDYKELAQGLMLLKRFLDEERALAEKLAEGILNVPLPGTENVLAYPLKALHSSLKHLVWQAKQIQKGDLTQRVDFMGDFSDVFNNMTYQLKNSREELELHAFRDPLTRLFNRRYGMEILDKMIREKRHFSLCFIDLDNLKYINDVLGHSEGDIFIMGVARQLETDLRDGLIARVGGDEFMALLPGFTESQAVKRMEEICERLKDFGKRPDGKSGYPLSYGVVEVKKDNEQPAGLILSEADKRMYALKAKHKEIFKENLIK